MPRILLVALCLALVHGEDLSGRTAQAVAGTLGAGRWTLDEPLRDLPVVLALGGNDPEAARQAFAHAIGAWWTPDQAGGLRFTRSSLLPGGTVTARSHISQLDGSPAEEALVRRLLYPWIPPTGGIASQYGLHRWSATLDGTGHARLIEVLTALERLEAAIPPWLEARIPAPLTPRLACSGWPALAAGLAEVIGLPVAVAADLGEPDGGWPIVLDRAEQSDLVLALAAHGVRAAWISGALCVGPAEDREHPASRRRIAAIPVRHLSAIATVTDLATRLKEDDPVCWTRPGWDLIGLVRPDRLLVLADPPTIHAVLLALAAIDRQGRLR